MKKINKSKLYELIGKATVRATVWAMSVYLVYQDGALCNRYL